MSELTFQHFGEDVLGGRGVMLPKDSDPLLVALAALDEHDRRRNRPERVVNSDEVPELAQLEAREGGVSDDQAKS